MRVPVTAGAVSTAALEADFHELHRRKYTFDLEGDSAVELVTFHVSAHGRAPREAALPKPSAPPGSTPTPKRPRVVDFDLDGACTRRPSTSATSFLSASRLEARS